MFRYNRAYGLECFIFLDTEISSTKIPPETWSDRLTSEFDPPIHKLPNIHVASVPFLSLASAIVMQQGQAAEAAKTSGHLLHIIMGHQAPRNNH